MSFDGSNDDDDNAGEFDEYRVRYCLLSQQTLDRTSLVIRDQLDASDGDLGKLQIPDITSVNPELPSPNLSQLM